MTGWIADVVPLTPIESVAWGNVIRDRTITPFLNVTQRTAQLPAPTEGMMSWLVDTNSLEVFNGTVWVSLTVGATADLTDSLLLMGG